MSKRKLFSLILFVLLLSVVLVSCSSNQYTCFYGYFEDSAYAFVYAPSTNRFYCIQLPLEQILLWGKASGLDSIPVAMRNFVGLKDSGFLLGTSNSLLTMKDLLDAIGSDSDEKPSNSKRVSTMVEKAAQLSQKPISDRISQLCGQDSEQMFTLLAEYEPTSISYDARGFFNSDDLNFSQRYFSQWLEQVLGGNI